MARHLKNERCPECAKHGKDKHGDNLGVYDDGSAYCYSCGFSNSNSNILRLHGPTRDTTRIPHQPILPEDVHSYIPARGLYWLRQYEITNNEITSNKILWSESKKYLIFPYFDTNQHLLGWQGRYFGPNEKHPKWVSYGNMHDIFHILPHQTQYSKIVLVEDIVSAIKVSPHSPAMPLFGASVGYKRATRLAHITSEIIIWLDPDKRKDSIKEMKRVSTMGLKCSTIFSDKDPKEHTNEEIEQCLRNTNT